MTEQEMFQTIHLGQNLRWYFLEITIIQPNYTFTISIFTLPSNFQLDFLVCLLGFICLCIHYLVLYVHACCIIVTWRGESREIEACLESGWPTTLFQCFDAVGWVIRHVKIIPEMTYYMSSETLNLTELNFQFCVHQNYNLIWTNRCWYISYK